MSIASTFAKVSSGSAKLSAIHNRTQMAADVRSVSPIRNVMRSSPSRLQKPVSPSVAGELRGYTTNDSMLSPTRPHSALPERSPRNRLPEDRPIALCARPGTAQASSRISMPRVALSRPATAGTSIPREGAHIEGQNNFIPTVDEGSDDDEILATVLRDRKFHVGLNTKAIYTDDEMAENELLASLEATYDRLRRSKGEAEAAQDESPTEAVYRLRKAIVEAQETSPTTSPFSDNTFGEQTNPDVLLLWSWSYAEDCPWRFLQEIKGRYGVGEAEAEGCYEQCEAIVQGLLKGQLPWDVPPVAIIVSDSLEAFMERRTRDYHGSVISALRVCCNIGGLDWSPALEATWMCALQHLRSGVDG